MPIYKGQKHITLPEMPNPATDIEEPHFVLDLGEIVLDIIIELEG